MNAKSRKWKPTKLQLFILRRMARGWSMLYNINEIAWMFSPNGKRDETVLVTSVDRLFRECAIERVKGKCRQYQLTDYGKKLAGRRG